MDIEEKQKFISIIEYIAEEASYCIEDSMQDIVNEALEKWPVIDGIMNNGLEIIPKAEAL